MGSYKSPEFIQPVTADLRFEPRDVGSRVHIFNYCAKLPSNLEFHHDNIQRELGTRKHFSFLKNACSFVSDMTCPPFPPSAVTHLRADLSVQIQLPPSARSVA